MTDNRTLADPPASEGLNEVGFINKDGKLVNNPEDATAGLWEPVVMLVDVAKRANESTNRWLKRERNFADTYDRKLAEAQDKVKSYKFMWKATQKARDEYLDDVRKLERNLAEAEARVREWKRLHDIQQKAVGENVVRCSESDSRHRTLVEGVQAQLDTCFTPEHTLNEIRTLLEREAKGE